MRRNMTTVTQARKGVEDPAAVAAKALATAKTL